MARNRRRQLGRTILGEAGIALPTDGIRLRLRRIPISEKAVQAAGRDPIREVVESTVKVRAVHSKDLQPIQWGVEHEAYRLGEDEISQCTEALPDNKLRWMLPVPGGDTPADRAVRKRFENDKRIQLRGVAYYVFETVCGFANAAKVARAGRTLHVWGSDPTLDYDIMDDANETVRMRVDKNLPPGAKAGRIKGKPGIVWDEPYVTYPLDKDEAVMCSNIPESELLWIVPIAKEEEADWDAVVRTYGAENIVRLNGVAYRIFRGVEGDVDGKIVSKVGDVLHIWYEESTDYEFLGEPSLSIEMPTGTRIDVSRIGNMTKLNSFCSAVFERRAHEQGYLLRVDHVASGCYEMIEAQPETSQMLITDDGLAMLIKTGKLGSSPYAEVEKRTGPVTRVTTKQQMGDLSKKSRSYEGLTGEHWKREIGEGFNIGCIGTDIKEDEVTGNPSSGRVWYRLTNREKPYYVRDFELDFKGGEVGEKTLKIGTGLIVNITVGTDGTWITVLRK